MREGERRRNIYNAAVSKSEKREFDSLMEEVDGRVQLDFVLMIVYS